MPAFAGIFFEQAIVMTFLFHNTAMKITHFLLLTGFMTAAGFSQAQATEGQAQMQLPRITLKAGMYQIDAQVARSPQEREIGLMYRKEMPKHEGMLFVFEQAGQQCFWMRNTRLPLTAAFVADDGTLVNLADMKPMTDDAHCSKKPVRYVLEMNLGWFASKKLKAGDKLSGPPFDSR